MSLNYTDFCINRADKAQQVLHDICNDPKKFRMCIPAQPDDSDMILQNTIDDCQSLARRLRNACRLFKTLSMNTACDEQTRVAFKAIVAEFEAIPDFK